MIRLRPSGADEVLIKRVKDWYEPGPGVFIAPQQQAMFSPAMLFTTGVNGAWYDPSDITRYMSSLGPELVTNGAFDSGTGWTLNSGATISGGALNFSSVAIASGAANIGNVTAGKWYKISYSVISFTSGGVSFSNGVDVTTGVNAVGAYSQYLYVTTSGPIKIVARFSSATLSIDNISVRELTDISTATLFQDAAGTTPVTAVGQPVGLMLDKSKGLVLGPELVTDYTQGYTAYGTANAALIGTEVIATADGSSATPGYYYAISTVVGQQYYVTGALRSPTTNTIYLSANYSASNGSIINRAGSYLATSTQVGFFFTAIGTTTYIFVYGTTSTSGNQYAAKNISVKYRPGNHAFNPSGNSANFPVLSARYNLLASTENVSGSGWGFINESGTATRTGNTITFGANAADRVQQLLTVVAALHSCTVRLSGSGDIRLILLTGIGTAAATLNVSLTSTPTDYTVSGATASAGASGGLQITNNSAGTPGASITFHRSDLRVSNDALNQPAYQRVNTATDYDTVGFKPYLSFNGVNQWLQTNSIDFTYGDKMFVSAGVRKLSDASLGMVTELSAALGSNNGTFYFVAPSGGSGNDYTFVSKGTSSTGAGSSSSYVSPITNVISGIGNISAPSTTLRVNGAQVAQSTATQGTGNYGNYPMYIGARAGTSLWFNGRLYGLVVAGKQASASEIASTEAYLNQKTGAY